MAFDVVAEVARSPEGVMTAEIERAAGRDVSLDLESAKASGSLISLAGLWLTPGAWEAVAPRLVTALQDLHRREPEVSGWPIEQVCESAGLDWRGKTARRAGQRLADHGVVRMYDDWVAIVGFRPRLTDKQEALLARVVAALDTHGLDTPEMKHLADETGLPRPAVEEIVRLGVEAGDLVWVDHAVYSTRYVADVLDSTKQRFGQDSFSLAEWRDAMGTSRRVAVAWLEYFDNARLTILSEGRRRVRDRLA